MKITKSHSVNILKVEQKIRKFKQQGRGKIMVVSDFDGTLSIASGPGRKYMTTFGTAKRHLGDEHEAKSVELYNHYHQFEYSSTITEKERNIKMREWCQKSMGLIVEYGFSKNTIDKIVKSKNILPRKGLGKFIKTLADLNVPTWLVSAGLGDVIQAFICDYSQAANLHIHSNFFEFDSKGTVSGFDPNRNVFIHDKHNSLRLERQFMQDARSRPLMLVLGDSPDDLDVISDEQNSLSIGFLDDDIEGRRNEFIENFDIVLERQCSLDEVLSLVFEQ
ncbi:MAG: haloacid dehalogenase-like hydrolase [Candidatus Dojkabacteria bacterium]|nr:haloacid dehalogenase-like hydrolase [Candidatus Dojkabacteria bacterium]